MITNDELNISSQSYVNKDFASLYPEMLDIASQLTNNWDPSTSNESDPGVVLLKEAAFVGDHNNYNIDKNVLENFLPSATQDKSVRNICEMNGYTPRYYVSAVGDVSFRYTFGEEETALKQFTIPRFTISATDADNTISYTQLDDLTILVNDKNIKSGATTAWCSCRFIEGALSTLNINSSEVITLDNLDDNYRVYLPETMIAQNGVFINYASDEEANSKYGYWERDNYIASKPLGTRAFKLDYDSDNDLPYIQFPSDIASIISSGLTIRYISTSGANGNVSSNAITVINSPSTITDDAGNEHASENFELKNLSAFINGKDPETLNEMYNSFKNVVGTFDTLVSCNDYSNYIRQLEDDGVPLVSNVYVTDRRTDYNRAANVVTYDDYGLYQENISLKRADAPLSFSVSKPSTVLPGNCWVENNNLMICTKLGAEKMASAVDITEFAELTKAMTPYDLCIYALSAYSVADYSISDKSKALNNSFKPVLNTTLRVIKNEIEDVKCLSHTYKDDIEEDSDVYCFKNLAPLQISIKPYNKINSAASNELVNNICKAISDNYNAHEVDFGEELDTTNLKKVIINSDTRIRDVDLQPLNYKTYATIYDGSDWKDTELMSSSTLMVDLIAKNILAGRVCLFNIDNSFDYEFGQLNCKLYENVNKLGSELAIKVNKAETTTVENAKTIKTVREIKSTGSNIKYYLSAVSKFSDEAYNPIKLTAGYEGYSLKYTELGENDTKNPADTFIIKYDDGTSSIYNTYAGKKDNTAVYTISFEPNDSTEINLINKKWEEDETLRKFETLEAGILKITIVSVDSSDFSSSPNISDYTLKENEAVQILYPNYYSDKTYSVYVNYRYIAPIGESQKTIYANEEHMLSANETLVLNYTIDGVTNTDVYTSGTIIKSSFNIPVTDTLSSSGIKKSWVDDNNIEHVDEQFRTLSSNQTISTRVQMKTILDNSNMLCYWIVDTNSDGEQRLFKKGSSTKILGANEYFIYANSNSNSTIDEMMILGSGTKLVRHGDITSEDNNKIWLIDNDLSIETISTYGASAAIDWKKINFSDHSMDVEEMSVITLGEGDTLSISGWTKTKSPEDSTSTDLSDNEFINNSWKWVNGNIRYNDTILPASQADFYYIRSRLDLNVGKNVIQKLYTKSDKVQKIIINGTSIQPELNSQLCLKASSDLYLLGEDLINNSYYQGSSIFKFVEDDGTHIYKLGATNISGISNPCEGTIPEGGTLSDTIKPEYKSKGLYKVEVNGTNVKEYFKYELPLFYSLKKGESVMIPVYIKSDNKIKVKAEMKSGSNVINILDYKTMSTAKTSLELSNDLYFITVIADKADEKNAVLTLTWELSGVIEDGSYKFDYDESVMIISNYKIVKGLNDKLLLNIKNVEESILKKIKSIIENSDKPHLPFYYLNEPSNDLAINLDKYCVTKTVLNAESGEESVVYNMKAFDNPLVMFDINNVAYDKTIVQVDIGGSEINIQSSMLKD